jgi:hypothetical protein
MTVDVMSSAYVAATLSKEAIEQSSVSFTSQSPKGGATAVLETKNCLLVNHLHPNGSLPI